MSRLRSVGLDFWSLSAVQHVLTLGNRVANATWEATIPAGWCRPSIVSIVVLTKQPLLLLFDLTLIPRIQ